MAYPVVLTGCGTALYVAPLQMLLTCDSLLVIRKTRVCRRRLYILRLKPKVICVTFHGGCIHFFENDKERKRICLGSCLNFWVQHLKCFEILVLFIAFCKPVPPLHFPAKTWVENSRLPGSARCHTVSVFKSHSGSPRLLERCPRWTASPLGAAACLLAS